jgi:hypothetical protein
MNFIENILVFTEAESSDEEMEDGDTGQESNDEEGNEAETLDFPVIEMASDEEAKGEDMDLPPGEGDEENEELGVRSLGTSQDFFSSIK